MTRVSFERAEARLTDLFAAAGASPANAASVAWALVTAEADGLKGHGLSRVPTYLAMLKSGKIDGQVVPKASRPKPGVLAIDAGHGFAYPAIDLAIAEIPDLAREQGIIAAPIRRSNHCGAAGLHVERLAEQGLVALLFANTPGAIAPWGGSKPVFGTNPIAFAAPLAGREPVVIDMALSKVARGPIVAAKQKGQPIPEGWALDVDGKPTTDATAALAGTMVPLGDAKGATLAMMVEILAAALVGAHFGFQASSFLDAQGGPPDTGQLILAIDPHAMGGNWFDERMRALVHAIEAQEGTRLPGVRRLTLRTKARAEGIEMPEEMLSP
ncbi:MAG: Ldh family oxidoreductase [Bosea sp. (in: a-proteobacteria)]|uniref:Ldh family oxidoreductase n=1 Tax=Bosea sp. (in: a-proteobacteria) TaxID=1871050 RepID=UPI002732ABE5|nr:Ldh family oxidoreductase [Bosea sp. (in: a-proteobacteria)]MDP3254589.1 Ldh family oxidoreductase [Bosea sp. (in: a-proteobacteria)]MDP3317789.1 Ldh family oxidoreductase [Bosea sp. (in: a-proteobacteria)]